MIDSTKTLDTIALAIDDVRRATPTSPAARSAMGDALGHLYMAEEALRKALLADNVKATYRVTRPDGTEVRVTVPEDDR